MIVAGEKEGFETLKRLRAHAVQGNVQLRGPHNRVEDQLAEIRVPPVRVEMAAGKTEAASAVPAFDRPADRKIIRLFRRSREQDGREARLFSPDTTAVKGCPL